MKFEDWIHTQVPRDIQIYDVMCKGSVVIGQHFAFWKSLQMPNLNILLSENGQQTEDTPEKSIENKS